MVADFTSRDEAAIKADMVKRIPFITSEWTDHNENDLGIGLLDEMSEALSVAHYYIDRAGKEAFADIDNGCIKRESLQKIFFFWNIPGKTPATISLKFSILASLKNDVEIPAGTLCQTLSNSSPIYFETDSILILKYTLLTADTDGTDLVSCVSTNFAVGQLVEINDDIGTKIQRTIIQIVSPTQIQLDSVVPSGFTTADNAYISALDGEIDATEGKTTEEVLLNSDGTEFQKWRTISKLIIDGTLSLVINEGAGDITWTAKETFYESGSTDTHFIWRRKWDDTIFLMTGDGAQGKIPINGATVKAEFREGGGAQGKVGANTIKKINDLIYVSGSPISITVNNPSEASGGTDRMDLDEAKVRGPEIIRANDRYISTPDFIAGAKSVFGVGNANAIRLTEPGSTYNVAVYIIPTGGGVPTTTLKNAVKAELESKCDIRVVPGVFDPGFGRIAVGGTIYLLSNYLRILVEAAVEAALADFFAVNNLEFGKSIRESDISRVIDEVEGVDYVDLTEITLIPRTDDIDLLSWSGDAIFGDISVGSAVVEEYWYITFFSPTAFSVRGSISGIQTALGTLGAVYTSDNSEISFTITAGSTPMSIGDNARFRTSDYRGNVEILDDEIAILDTDDLTYSGGG